MAPALCSAARSDSNAIASTSTSKPGFSEVGGAQNNRRLAGERRAQIPVRRGALLNVLLGNVENGRQQDGRLRPDDAEAHERVRDIAELNVLREDELIEPGKNASV